MRPLDGVRIIGASELPAALAAVAEATEWTEVIAIYDRPRGLACSAAPLGDGRFALAEEDTLTHSGSYITVGLAPQGPVAGLRSP